jgi:hypothetical protein
MCEVLGDYATSFVNNLSEQETRNLDVAGSCILILADLCSTLPSEPLRLAICNCVNLMSKDIAMARQLVPSQQKLAEKLSLINDRGIGMLTRIYNIKKVIFISVLN